MLAQRELGHETLEGGGGGNFLRSALFRWKADVIHFHWLHPYMVRPTLLGSWTRSMRFAFELACLRLGGKKLVWTMHNIQSHDAKFPRTERFFRRIAAKAFHKIVCHSDAAATLAKKTLSVSDSKIVRSPHPSYIDVYPNQLDQQAERDKAGIGSEETVFLFVGRVAEYKGIEELIATFKNLGCENCRLIVAGNPVDDEYGEKIRTLAEKNDAIDLSLQYIPDAELPSLMAVADVVVLPFKNILNSGSVVLAMSFAKAVIVPAEGSVPEVVPASPLVYAGSLGNAMDWAVKNKPRLPGIGKKNYSIASSWTWGALAKAGLDGIDE